MAKYAEKNARDTGANTVDAYKAKLFEEAEKIVHEGFPRKIIELSALLEDQCAAATLRLRGHITMEFLKSERYSYKRIDEIVAEFDDMRITKPKIAADGSTSSDKENVSRNDGDAALFNGAVEKEHANIMVPCNAKLEELLNELRQILMKAVDDINKVRMWITLLLPKIEDGNNFGVAIQEMILRQVKAVENMTAGYVDQRGRYYALRAKFLSKVEKNPHLADYRRTVQDCDESQFVNIRDVIQELRNYFAGLYDLITKNIEKIRRPRSNVNLDHMY